MNFRSLSTDIFIVIIVLAPSTLSSSVVTINCYRLDILILPVPPVCSCTLWQFLCSRNFVLYFSSWIFSLLLYLYLGSSLSLPFLGSQSSNLRVILIYSSPTTKSHKLCPKLARGMGSVSKISTTQVRPRDHSFSTSSSRDVAFYSKYIF